MIKQRYTLDDLMMELRNNNIKNLKDVEYAVLENSGKLNIFKYSFLGIDSANPFPLILDGVIQKDHRDIFAAGCCMNRFCCSDCR